MVKIQIVLLAALALCPASKVFAADDQASRDSLKGLPGVFVVVDDLDPAIEKAGLTKADLQNQAEEELRRAGVPVLSREQWVTTAGGPYLHVSAFVLSSSESVWPFFIEVSSMQRVALERSSLDIFFAPTWSVATVGSVGSNKVLQVSDIVKEYVDQFAKAFLAVNPR